MALTALHGHLTFQAITLYSQLSQAPTVTGHHPQTHTFAVSPATATPAPTAAPVTGLATMSALTYGIVAAVIAIIIAIAIVGLLLMRKKP